MIQVRSWGIASSVVDAGHPGRCWLGQSRGGAVDVQALALANRLVGNAEHAAGFETSVGLTLSFTRPTMVAVAGALADVVVTGGPPLGWGSPVVVTAGASLRVGRLLDGARAYLAVRGGLVGSTDDDTLAIGRDPGTAAASQPAPRAAPLSSVRIWPGPRLDWFADGSWERLLRADYVIGPTSRVGTRLQSLEPLVRVVPGELPSEGLLEGAIQVPPDGQPIIMLADHPTTGGYPVIAVVDPADIPIVAQAAPGTPFHLRPA